MYMMQIIGQCYIVKYFSKKIVNLLILVTLQQDICYDKLLITSTSTRQYKYQDVMKCHSLMEIMILVFEILRLTFSCVNFQNIIKTRRSYSYIYIFLDTLSLFNVLTGQLLTCNLVASFNRLHSFIFTPYEFHVQMYSPFISTTPQIYQSTAFILKTLHE